MKQNVSLNLGDYVLVFVLMVVAVTAGTLLANYITLRVLAHETEQAIQTETARMTERSRETASRARAESEARAERQRIARSEDATGRTLRRTCEEWRESHRVNNTTATHQGMTRHCARYESYVETGQVLPR